MNIVFLGPPGAGKGTQSVRMAQRFRWPHISTGDMLRAAVARETDLGREAKTYMDRGDLVPDEVVIGIVLDRIGEDDCNKGFILDGFPRTINQARRLEEALGVKNKGIELVLNIDVDRAVLIKRITGRRVCRSCGRVWHLDFNPPAVEVICDNCSGELFQREDDSEESVKNRLNVYDEQTKPLISYYADKDILENIDGGRKIEEVFDAIVDTVNAKLTPSAERN